MTYELEITFHGTDIVEKTFQFDRSGLVQISTRSSFCDFVYRNFYSLPFRQRPTDDIAVQRRVRQGGRLISMNSDEQFQGLLSTLRRKKVSMIVHDHCKNVLPSHEVEDPHCRDFSSQGSNARGHNIELNVSSSLGSRSEKNAPASERSVAGDGHFAETTSERHREKKSINQVEAGDYIVVHSTEPRPESGSTSEPQMAPFTQILSVSVVPKFDSLAQIILCNKSTSTVDCGRMALSIINCFGTAVASVSLDRPQGIAPSKVVKFNLNVSSTHFKYPFSVVLTGGTHSGKCQLSSKCFESEIRLSSSSSSNAKAHNLYSSDPNLTFADKGNKSDFLQNDYTYQMVSREELDDDSIIGSVDYEIIGVDIKTIPHAGYLVE